MRSLMSGWLVTSRTRPPPSCRPPRPGVEGVPAHQQREARPEVPRGPLDVEEVDSLGGQVVGRQVVAERRRVHHDLLAVGDPQRLAHPLTDLGRLVGLQHVVARVADLEHLGRRAGGVQERCPQQRRRVRRGGDEVVPGPRPPVEAVDLAGREAALLPPLVAHHLVGIAVHRLDDHLAARLGVPLRLVDVDHHVARRRQRLVPLRGALDERDAPLGHRDGVVAHRPVAGQAGAAPTELVVDTQHVAVGDLAVERAEEHAVLRGLLDLGGGAEAVLVALAAYVVGQRLQDVEGEERRPVRRDLHQDPEAVQRLVDLEEGEQVGRRRDREVLLAIVAGGPHRDHVAVGRQRQAVVPPARADQGEGQCVAAVALAGQGARHVEVDAGELRSEVLERQARVDAHGERLVVDGVRRGDRYPVHQLQLAALAPREPPAHGRVVDHAGRLQGVGRRQDGGVLAVDMAQAQPQRPRDHAVRRAVRGRHRQAGEVEPHPPLPAGARGLRDRGQQLPAFGVDVVDHDALGVRGPEHDGGDALRIDHLGERVGGIAADAQHDLALEPANHRTGDAVAGDVGLGHCRRPRHRHLAQPRRPADPRRGDRQLEGPLAVGVRRDLVGGQPGTPAAGSVVAVPVAAEDVEPGLVVPLQLQRDAARAVGGDQVQSDLRRVVGQVDVADEAPSADGEHIAVPDDTHQPADQLQLAVGQQVDVVGQTLGERQVGPDPLRRRVGQVAPGVAAPVLYVVDRGIAPVVGDQLDQHLVRRAHAAHELLTRDPRHQVEDRLAQQHPELRATLGEVAGEERHVERDQLERTDLDRAVLARRTEGLERRSHGLVVSLEVAGRPRALGDRGAVVADPPRHRDVGEHVEGACLCECRRADLLVLVQPALGEAQPGPVPERPAVGLAPRDRVDHRVGEPVEVDAETAPGMGRADPGAGRDPLLALEPVVAAEHEVGTGLRDRLDRGGVGLGRRRRRRSRRR